MPLILFDVTFFLLPFAQGQCLSDLQIVLFHLFKATSKFIGKLKSHATLNKGAGVGKMGE